MNRVNFNVLLHQIHESNKTIFGTSDCYFTSVNNTLEMNQLTGVILKGLSYLRLMLEEIGFSSMFSSTLGKYKEKALFILVGNQESKKIHQSKAGSE